MLMFEMKILTSLFQPVLDPKEKQKYTDMAKEVSYSEEALW